MVTTNAAYAAGFPSPASPLEPRAIDLAAELGAEGTATLLHDCASVQEAVLAPPHGRTAWRNGRKVAERKVESWVAEEDQ
jgi:hypothetical protein